MATQARAAARTVWRLPTDVRIPLPVRLALVVGALLALLALTLVVTTALGAVAVPLDVSAAVLLRHVGIETGVPTTEAQTQIIGQIRLPRVVVAGLVGAALAAAGTAMQGLFRNPLADPGIIGVSTGGALGAVLAIYLGLHQLHYLALPGLAFGGALAVALLVYGIAVTRGVAPLATMILAGAAISAFVSAVISAILTLLADANALREIIFWLTGSLAARSWTHVQLIAPPILVGMGLLCVFARDLNVMLLGEDSARSLGVNVVRTRLILLGLSSLVTAVGVAVSGVIGFVGLIVPHVLRLLVGPDHRLLFPASILGGATFLIWADFASRMLFRPQELRVSLVTAFLGAPFFLFLLYRNKRRSTTL